MIVHKFIYSTWSYKGLLYLYLYKRASLSGPSERPLHKQREFEMFDRVHLPFHLAELPSLWEVFFFFFLTRCCVFPQTGNVEINNEWPYWFKIFFVNVDWNSYGNKQTMNQKQRAAMTVWYTVTIYYIIPSRDQRGGVESLILCWYKNKDCQGWSGFTQCWWVMNHQQQLNIIVFPPVNLTSWMMVR